MGMMINRRRTYGGKKLPYDAEVEYLESSGTQYIDTLVTYNTNNKYEIICDVMFKPIFTPFYLNGWDGGGVFGVKSGGYISNGAVSDNVYIVNKKVLMNLIINSGSSSDTLLLVDDNGAEYTFSRTHDSLGMYAGNHGWCLFACRSQDYILYRCSERVYKIKIYQNNIITLDLIPVRVGTTGYMYDKVSGQLFGNNGTGSFIVGPDV